MIQATLKSPVALQGIGLHTGRRVTLRVRPAPAGHGICFHRVDVTDRDYVVPATWQAVTKPQLCTRIENKAGVSVSTIEHVMAALAGVGIHNAVLELDAPEVPILDGSAIEFLARFQCAGLRSLNAPVSSIEVVKPVEVRNGRAWARLEPAEAREIDVSIAFCAEAIGSQKRRFFMDANTFAQEIADSRTFCLKEEVEQMRKAGRALGGTLENAVVVDGANVLSPGGMRHRDEAVRHKILDVVGDLALAGAPVLGRYVAHRPGHALTNRLLRALFAESSQYRIVRTGEATPERQSNADHRISALGQPLFA